MVTPLVRDSISQLVSQAIEEARREGLVQLETSPEVLLERPGNPGHGDFATSLPLRLARATRINPLEMAQMLVERMPVSIEVTRVEAAHPGFINFFLGHDWVQQQVEVIRRAGPGYGRLNLGNGQKVMVEFVSVNPTGPVHVGHTRGAVMGSTLAAILDAAGFNVTREYYINDAGNQMDLFYRSVYARYLQSMGRDAGFPANGYQGDYISDLGREIGESAGTRFLEIGESEAISEIGDLAREKMVAIIRQDLEDIGVEFDNWFSERSLYRNGEYDKAMDLLRCRNFLSQRDDALWFNSSMLGEEKDNVVVRSTGEPTYFASDIAYHFNKFVARDYAQVIDIWGADHQGHVPRMKAAVEALGIDPEALTILISQLVTLKRGDDTVRASKRTGDFVTLKELVDEVGSDACRYFFLARAPSTQMDFDLELAKKESSENPVYYVQYAHARIASILNLAAERGLDFDEGDVSLLTDSNELNLVRTMLRFPELIELMAKNLEPHHLPHYAMELATAFHWFYENCRVVSSNPEDLPLTLARLKLVDAARITLQRVLELMGMNAPERM